MRKSAYVLCFFVLSFLLNAKLINTNPDPNGEPWYAGGISELTDEQLAIVKTIPVLSLPECYKNRKFDLPYTVDNSLLPYFRPVFNQQGGSCAQASAIGYTYTYEQNLANGTSANVIQNQYPTHYTYNFLNNADPENGTVYFHGWDIAIAGGIPNVETYGGLWPSTDPDTMYKLWMSGYDKYESGMSNHAIEKLSIPVGTPEGLETLKQWFNDHCDGSGAGGLAVFSAGVYNTFTTAKLPSGTNCAGEVVVLNWDRSVNHSMTLVGYNDSIRWDYNNDGKYTNDIDITGDGLVDMKDWEIGGVRLVNSWGESWADKGKAWVMYRTLALNYTMGGIYGSTVYSIRTKDKVKPKLKIKATIDYDERNDLKIMAGIAKDFSALQPEYLLEFPYFNYQGGDSIGMAGNGNVLELGLDVSPILDNIIYGEDAKLFFCVEQKRGVGGIGKIVSCSVIDEEGKETVSDQKDIDIIPGATTYATFDIQQGLEITTTNLPSVLLGSEYSYPLTADKGTPQYSWKTVIDYYEVDNISSFPSESLKKLTMSNNDDGFAVVDLDFQFPFFDELYNSITVTTNGAITFNNSYEDVKTLSDIQSTKTIAPCAAEFKLSSQGGIYYYANEDYVIINWIVTIPISGTGGSSSGTGSSLGSFNFSAKLFSDGKIEFFYGLFTQWIQRVAAISNGSPESTFISKYSNVYHQSNLLTAFYTNPYPHGMKINSEGIFYGTIIPINQTEWSIVFKVTDANDLISSKEFRLSLADPSAVLSEPQNPSIIKNEPSAVLSWDHVQGATVYRVYRSADPYSGFIQIGTSTSLSYEDSDLLPGNKYFYYVTADNSK